MSYLREWASSKKYRHRRENYQRPAFQGAVDVESESPGNQVEALRRQIKKFD